MLLNVLVTLLAVNYFTLTAGEVNFCLKLDSSLSNDETTESISNLFQGAHNDILDIFGEDENSFTYDSYHLHFSHPAITIDANFSEGIVSVSKPYIQEFSFKPEGFEIINITINNFYADGNYILNGFIGDHLFDIYGDGKFSINFTDLSVAAFTGLKINSSDFCLPFTLNIDMRKCSNNLENLMNGEEELEPLINRIFERLIPEAAVVIWREIADASDSYIQSVIDDLLKGSISTSLVKVLTFIVNNKNKITSDYIENLKESLVDN
ncbi:uncharacterized protein LOC143196058 [Rhynchophorus ferrugineus]